MGIIGMVLGIVSLVLEFVSFILICDTPYSYYSLDNWLEGWLSPLIVCFVFSVTGLVLSIVGKSIASRRGCGNGPAKAGIICSAIALGFFVFLIVLGTMTYDLMYYDLRY